MDRRFDVFELHRLGAVSAHTMQPSHVHITLGTLYVARLCALLICLLSLSHVELVVDVFSVSVFGTSDGNVTVKGVAVWIVVEMEGGKVSRVSCICECDVARDRSVSAARRRRRRVCFRVRITLESDGISRA